MQSLGNPQDQLSKTLEACIQSVTYSGQWLTSFLSFLSITLEGMAEVTSVIKDILFYDTHEPCGLYQQHPLKCVSHAGGMR